MWNWLIAFILLFVLAAVLLSIFSHYRKNETGLVAGRLRNCPDKPNCVCSEDRAKSSFVEPVIFSTDPDIAWEKAAQAVLEMEGKPVSRGKSYLHAVFTSPVFRFVDDLELRLDSGRNTIHIRSSARVGYSDMGVNRKRAQEFRRRLTQKL